MGKRLITRDDIIRGGACFEGVYEWAHEHAPDLTAIDADAALELCSDDGGREHIKRALGLAGNGDGNGDGDGYGYGYGDGNGNGDGDGNGYGNGYGDGDGYGYGYGNGDGNGGYRDD